ncbi:MAG: hypothetical protein JWO81_3036 [Alphaproteobacteria bacterium]|nr:hypothetical protein [Alphaproteobacteria bacterium]
MRMSMIVPLCLAAAACSGGGESDNQAADAPATLPAGTWQADFEVKSFRSTDQTTPALKAKNGDKEHASSCVPEAQRMRPAPELFAGAGYSCTYQNSYIKGGIINAALACTRPELKGQINMAVQGSYTADGFEATVESISYLPGPGDFTMSRKVKAKLTPGACQPAPAAADGSGNAAAPAKGKAGG